MDRERIPRWFLPVSGDLELGGRYQLEGNAGGSITACERPSHFALTWEFGGGVSWVDVRVADDGTGRARLTLAHIAHLSPHWDEYGPGAAGVGWEMGRPGLALHLADPTAPKPDEEAFAASRHGRAFIAGSGDGWGQAAVAAGEDSPAARAARGHSTPANRPNRPDASRPATPTAGPGRAHSATGRRPVIETPRRSRQRQSPRDADRRSRPLSLRHGPRPVIEASRRQPMVETLECRGSRKDPLVPSARACLAAGVRAERTRRPVAGRAHVPTGRAERRATRTEDRR